MKTGEDRLFVMDKKAISVAVLGEESDERVFWLKKSPNERLRALEYLRQVAYGYDPLTARLQRFFESAEY